MLGSSDTVNDELDLIHETKIALANSIRDVIMKDVLSGRFSPYELAGRLGKNAIGIEAFKTRKVWTLDYAILAARKLGYALGTIAISTTSSLPDINPNDKSWIEVLNARNNTTRQAVMEPMESKI